MIAFIDDHREAHGVEPICKVLPTAPSTYYDHVARRRDPARLSALAKRDMALNVEVRRVFEENFRVYGVRKVWRQLQRGGFQERGRYGQGERTGPEAGREHTGVREGLRVRRWLAASMHLSVRSALLRQQDPVIHPAQRHNRRSP